jgi:hypothetical protein
MTGFGVRGRKWAASAYLAALLAGPAACIAPSTARATALVGNDLITDGTFLALAAGVSNTTGGYVCNNTVAASCKSDLSDWSGTCAPQNCSGTLSPGSILIRGTNGAYFNPSYTSGIGLYWNGIGDPGTSGNEIGLDGDSNYVQTIFQTVSGLIVGQNYQLQFYQASAQEHSFSGATTEQWQVTFGGSTQTSTLMNTASHGSTPWTLVTMEFTATATSQVLTFLSLGSPHGEPPIDLLADVSMYEDVPEPASVALVGVGLVAVWATARRRRRTA